MELGAKSYIKGTLYKDKIHLQLTREVWCHYSNHAETDKKQAKKIVLENKQDSIRAKIVKSDKSFTFLGIAVVVKLRPY